MKADLHLHTTASDGTLTPEELVTLLKDFGIVLMAVTDHDSIANVRRAKLSAAAAGIHFISGVEMTTVWKGEVTHVLGYGIDIDQPEINAFISKTLSKMLAGNDEGMRVLIKAGYDIDYDEYSQYSFDRRRGGWKALNYLIDIGLIKNIDEFFNKLFTGDLKWPVPNLPTPEEAASAIKRAGGIPVLAHPGDLEKAVDLELVLSSLDKLGIEGIECYHRHNSVETTRRCLDWCHRYNLVITGGSDYHGGFTGRLLGEPLITLDMLNLGRLNLIYT